MNNHYKFYKFLEILKNETDENHILTSTQLIARLRQVTGTNTDRRAIYEYINTLKELNFDISDYEENGEGYYLRSSNLEEHEIRILMDLIVSCKFITHKKTNEIIEKLKQLNSNYVYDRLYKQLYIDNRVKSNNNQIFYTVDKINHAIIENKKISFNYCHYNMWKELLPRADENNKNKLYIVSPVAMILKQECYYLVAVHDNYTKASHYRMDKIRNIEILEDDRVVLEGLEEFKDGFDGAIYSKKSFRMYAGEECTVVLKMNRGLLDSIVDELGRDVELMIDESGDIIAKFTAKYSVGLKRWIMQFGCNAELLEPVKLRDEIKSDIIKMKDIYLKL
ncbi:WYL domain-containing protein [Clostridium sp. 19966]|uniref:helix-turn-helix transcriptional regulator n=1 Tax=Clostridium sp. 19966 TaxID=2768166 RepID=UPI0028DD92B9|nr:WYL domain-containing protein [Clostridium sp. 19966]MDT8718381.1 WYL domain-containing protein [Clostridium sp. 19966]